MFDDFDTQVQIDEFVSDEEWLEFCRWFSEYAAKVRPEFEKDDEEEDEE